MTDDHKHVWGPSGCWCGAKQCEVYSYGKGDGKTVTLLYGPKEYRCKSAAGPNGKRCSQHLEPEGYKDATFGG